MNLAATHALHERLAACQRNDPAAIRDAQRISQETIQRLDARFEANQQLRPSLSALVLDPVDVQRMATLAESLHAIVELTLDTAMADAQLLQRWFPAHARMFPHLIRTRGLETWQGYSRYDSVVTPAGKIKLLELNTCCPAGFFHVAACNEATLLAFDRLGLTSDGPPLVSAALEADALVDAMLHTERQAGLPPTAVALLNDENGLQNELDLLAAEFTRRGREVVRGDAGEIHYNGQTPRLDGVPFSLSFNKIRISTPGSPNHRWAPGFEERYAGFLAAMRDGAFVSINNSVAATLGEDKGLLQLLTAPEITEQLDSTQRELIREHVLWTAALKPGTAWLDGDEVDLFDTVRSNRERFVIKPANEGRGFGVRVGRYCTEAEWAEACCPPPELPCVVQEYAEPVSVQVPTTDADPIPMHLTIAMGLVRGRYRGLFSRISPDPVTNVGRAGIVQAVLRSAGD